MSCPRGAELRIEAVSIEITNESLDFLVQECKYALILKAREEERKMREDASRFSSPKAAPRRRTMDGSPMSVVPTELESTPGSSQGGLTPRRSSRARVKVVKQTCYYIQKRRAYIAKITREDGKSSYKSFRVASPKSAARMKVNAKAAAMAWIKGMGGKSE